MLEAREVRESGPGAEKSDGQRLLERKGGGDDLPVDRLQPLVREGPLVGGGQAADDFRFPLGDIEAHPERSLDPPDLQRRLRPAVQQGEDLVVDRIDLGAKFLEEAVLAHPPDLFLIAPISRNFLYLRSRSFCAGMETRGERLDKRRLQRFGRGLVVPVRAAHRLGDDPVDHPEFLQIGSGDLHHVRRDFRLRGVPPKDQCAPLRRNDRIDGIFHHQDLVADPQCQRAAASAFADHRADDRRTQQRHFQEVARDGLGLAALLGPDPRERARPCR